MRLQGKTAVITGAASGIGRSMARRFAAEGARIVAVDMDEAKLAKVVTELDCAGVIADISNNDDVARMLDHERVDILCNNAGILDALTPVGETSDEMWDRLMAVNLTGPFKAIRAAVAKMSEQGGGVILNTCSAASLSGGRAGAAYTASKHGLLGLTRSTAWFYSDQNIRCNAIAPGAIQTKIHFRDAPHEGGFAKYSKYFETIPPHGKALAVADVALFLVSDDSRYVNGEVVSVDGGWNAF